MKTISVFFTLLFVFSVFSSFSQEQVIKLKMEEGVEYIYELQEKDYVQKGNKINGPSTIKKKVLSLKLDSIIPEKLIIINVNIIEIYIENVSNILKDKTDYIYQDFRDFGIHFVPAPESFFSSSDLIFRIDLIQRKIELLNKAELLENYHKFLEQRNSFEIEEKTELFDTIYLNQITNIVEFLLWFHNTKITSEGTISQSYLKDKLVLKEKNGTQFSVINETESIVKPGRDYKHFSINVECGLLEKYDFIRKDSIKNNYGKNVGEYLYNVAEKNYKLLSKRNVKKGAVKIYGKIENSLSNKLYIFYLDEPFGVQFKKKTIFLDEEGSFNTEINLNHSEFIFIENPNPNRLKPSAFYTLFAEQGDSIYFSDDLNNTGSFAHFTGSKTEENILLHKIMRKFNILKSGMFIDKLHPLNYDERINYEQIIHIDPDNIPKMLNDIFTELGLVEQILAESQVKKNSFSYQYIFNELKNYYYGIIFHYLTITIVIEKKEQLTIHIPNSIQDELKDINLNAIYNDFGFYSRKCISNYLRYKYFKTNEISNSGIIFGRKYIPDLNQHIQFDRMIITGSPLYREIAALLEESITSAIYLPWKDYQGHILDVTINNLNLITTNCNDREIVKKVEEILIQYNKLQDKDPEIKELIIYNNEHQKLKLNEIVKSKPTVILFALNLKEWSFTLDQYVEENPEINFIRVAQGSNFREWDEFNEISSSKVPSFLYLNDSILLEDIFLKSMVIAVFNKQGDLINYWNDSKSAVKSAKESLNQKKQLDKSQLISIIVILSATLILLVFGVLIWKWRVRQRFRREQQQRRLRELELTAIRSQMNPHFLFNSLNSVQNLVQQNKGREAHLYLADFAGLIRKVLQNSEKEEVSLAEELEMTEQYLNLEKLRFDFDFSISVEQGIDIHNTTVPSMLLQPFAENAVIHGLQNKPEDRKLKIEVMRNSHLSSVIGKEENSGIVISIEDNGIGRETAAAISKTKNGKGTKLIQERLEILQEKQGEKYRLEITDLTGNETGTRVEIFIPEEK